VKHRLHECEDEEGASKEDRSFIQAGSFAGTTRRSATLQTITLASESTYFASDTHANPASFGTDQTYTSLNHQAEKKYQHIVFAVL
jgi:hypothetical protein